MVKNVCHILVNRRPPGSGGLDVVEAGKRDAAEMAYQRALAALHQARADLSDLSAAKRRFAYDRPRLTAEAAATQAAELETVRMRLLALVERLRQQAATTRTELRRLTDDPDAEPDELPDEPAEEGFHQPRFEAGQ